MLLMRALSNQADFLSSLEAARHSSHMLGSPLFLFSSVFLGVQ